MPTPPKRDKAAYNTWKDGWNRDHTTRVYIRLNNRTDADIIQRLQTLPNVQGYIKSLIRADITKGANTMNTAPNAAEMIHVNEAELRQEGIPATAYWAIDAIRANDQPDDLGAVDLYEMVWYADDPETIDWDTPDEIRRTRYGWLIRESRIV